MLGALVTPAAAAAQNDLPLIPWPRHIERDTGEFTREGRIELRADGVSAELVEYAADLFENEIGVRPMRPGRGAEKAIVLALEPDSGAAESYRLAVTSHAVRLTAGTEAGLFRGMQTLRQLLSMPDGRIPALRIEDAPRFSWRGAHLDVARHRFPVEFIKRYIDLISRYKLNTFHWHLTDDQGWRIEIRTYPRLTEVGAWRKETIVGKNFDPYVGDGIRYGGYYTQDEVRDVVAYAAERHVTVVPEIEMPGHAKAAIAAYPWLACTAGPFEVWTMWGVHEDIFCPHEETFTFLENVLTEVMELFPGPWIHIGGDEAPKRRWKESPVAQAVIRREGLKDEHELQSWFVQRIERFLSSHGRRMIGWDEILEGGLAPGATVMSWRGVDGGIAAAKAGHDVIMSPGSHLYFDHAQGPPELEPLSIGGNTPLDRVYGFEPIPPELQGAERSHILGAQANMWTEYLKTPEQVEYMLFPRLLALAEVVWSPADARDWGSFTRRAPAALAALDRLGVNYRVPHVEGLEGDRVFLGDTAVIELESLLGDAGTIRYTADGTDPTSASSAYAGPLRIVLDTGSVTLSARLFLADGRSSPPRSARLRRTTLRAAETVAAGRLGQGIRVTYFPRAFRSARAVTGADGGTAGIVDSIARAGTERAETYGLRFSGYIRVPSDGIYELMLVSDDGSVLTIGGEVIVDNDGMHSETGKTGMVALARGLHPLEVAYVQGGGGASLRVLVRKEGGEWEPLAGIWLARRE
ncbi:MAG TPA: family 20 glycosylhydrolase [Gemmatimonadales bacterium]|nr:family 20 glycosylhydrolase [Gemmatimonadales bacterium]